jgi:Ca2+-binding RTX toxin-like protein
MATFYCYVSTTNFGGGYPPSFNYYPMGPYAFELDSPEFYEWFTGSFGYYADSTPYGYVYTYSVYDYGNNLTRYWVADAGTSYYADDIFNLKDTGSWRDFFKYMFYLDDDIYGSPYKDKLNGYNGNDWIAGNEGNDKLKGGPGYDDFYFEAFDGTDVIKDFKWPYDSIWLDSSLATNMNQVYNAAYKFKKGVLLDFGDTVIKIPKLKPGNFDDADFYFV